LSEGSACAADFWAVLGVLAWFCPLGATVHAELANMTANVAASESTRRRVRGTTTRPVAPLNVTCVLPSSFC